MIYRVTYPEAIVQFQKNQGKVILEATSPEAAISGARVLFSQMRDEVAHVIGPDQYAVTFKVQLDYRVSLRRSIDKAIRMIVNARFYAYGRYLDRYIVASIASETGRPEWLVKQVANLREEITSLRTAAIVAREVARLEHFIDWDICIHNYIELNDKEGHRSRVVRRVQ